MAIHGDIGKRPQLTVSTIPQGVTGLFETSFSVSAGTNFTVAMITTPQDDRLSLWNFLFSVYVDTDAYTHILPAGASLTAAQKKIRVTHWLDWADSSDIDNERSHRFLFENYDTSSHTLYFKYKAYTFAAITQGA